MTFSPRLIYHILITLGYAVAMTFDFMGGTTGSPERFFLLILCLMIFYCWDTLLDISTEIEMSNELLKRQLVQQRTDYQVLKEQLAVQQTEFYDRLRNESERKKNND